jgi:hypothetical protein
VAAGFVVAGVTHAMDDTRHPNLDDGYTPELFTSSRGGSP